MNAYSFPEGAIISDAARNIITDILNLDPLKRPNIDQITNHEFFNQGTSIMTKMGDTAGLPGTISDKNKTESSKKFEGFLGDTGRPLTVPINTGSKKIEKMDSLNSNLKDSKNNFNFNSTDKKLKTPTQNQISKTISNSQVQGPEIWVKKWVDYSSKYGLGYLLSNGSSGVFFNDSSKIILDSKGVNFNFIDRRATDKQEIVSTHTLTDYPKDLTKKVTLLQHFRGYLEGEVKNENVQEMNIDESKNNVYVKKWMRTRHAIMFRLSNKIVQVCFQDHTEIILSSESRVVTYVNKNAERSTYPLNTALDSNNYEMTKRLKYTKDILTHMLTQNNNANGTTGASASSQGMNNPLD